ncbi:MAG: hypothetical protein OXQ28_01935 [Acidobacteriota bacterium]|nr:hypothetical protein [Acidobacteriota bacterium]
MRIEVDRAGNTTKGAIESAGITVLSGSNIEGRSALLTMAYAASRAAMSGT